MYDIATEIQADDAYQSGSGRSVNSLDPHGPMYVLDHWSARVAGRIAQAEGIALEDDHWMVVFFLREQYRALGPEWSARAVMQEMHRQFADFGGRRFLYELFPRGPLAQACRIAGLPLPQGTLDRSFGSVH